MTDETKKLQKREQSPSCRFTKPSQLEIKLIHNDGISAMIEWSGARPQLDALTESAKNRSSYEVSWHSSEGDRGSEKTKCKEYAFTKLTPGAAYSVYVVEINKAGESVPSETVTFNSAPRMPHDIRANHYDASPCDSIIVSFEHDSDREMSYKVMAEALLNDEEKILETKKKCVLLQNLTPGESYSVHVIAVAGNFESKKASCSGMIQTYPDIPQKPRIERDGNDLTLSWKQLNINPTAYKVIWRANDKEFTSEVKEPSFILHSMKPSTVYKFRIAARNAAGCSGKSEEVKYTTAPAAPVNVQVTPNSFSPQTSFVVKYDDSDALKKTYKVVAMSMDGKLESQSTSDSRMAVLNDLQPGRPYIIYVMAVYQGLESQKSYCVDKCKNQTE